MRHLGPYFGNSPFGTTMWDVLRSKAMRKPLLWGIVGGSAAGLLLFLFQAWLS